MPDRSPEQIAIANRDAFASLRQQLLAEHEGKFALIHAGQFVQTFDSVNAAYDYAVEHFGVDPIYIGHVTKQPDIQQIPALYHGLITARI